MKNIKEESMIYSLQQIYSLLIYKHSLKRKEVDLQAINHT